MNYLLTPMYKHFDSGFGATGNSFKQAGDKLWADLNDNRCMFNEHLPALYLYRHAIELFLKSGVIIFHRLLKLPYGSDPHDSEPPKVLISGGWKSLYRVHSVFELNDYLMKLFNDHQSYLQGNTKADWSFPSEFDEWIKIIEENDSASTFFRYPVSKNDLKDKEKDSMKEASVESLTQDASSQRKPMIELLVKDNDGNAVNLYRLDDEPVKEIATAIKNAAEMLYNLHAAMRSELCKGW